MKKKVLAVMMAVSMMAMVVSGCGNVENTVSDDVTSSVEESQEDSTPESSSAEASVEAEAESEEVGEVVESAEESAVEDSVEESVEETTEESGEETEEETIDESDEESSVVVIEETEEETTEAEVVDADGKDWSLAYDDYFERDNIMSSNVQVSIDTIAEDAYFSVVVAAVDGVTKMSYVFEEAAFDMYANSEKIYACVSMQGEEQWLWAPAESDEDVDSLVDMADTGIVNTEYIESCVYREAIVDDGVIYDVLDVSINDGSTAGEAVYFINRETQKMESCVMEQDGVTAVCLIEEIDSIEIPAEAENGTESTPEDIAMSMIAVMLAGAGMGME